jgi:hypothetical protein
MSGVVFLLVISIGLVSIIAVGNAIAIANEGHERAGLLGNDLRRHHLELATLTAQIAEEETRAELASLGEMVAALDRVAFAGVPLAQVAPANDPGWWAVTFRDGTALCVRAANPRLLLRANQLASRDPLVVTKVHPSGDAALVELATPRHRSLRVALRA